ncbi:MAG: hypothetical protein ABIY50_11120 [Ignavibacteria bacterium]
MNMQAKKNKSESLADKVIRGIKIGRQKMLEEKSLKGQYIVYEENGKIKKEMASDILKREKKMRL